MSLVTKHLDLIIGVDIHITIMPPPAPPTPLPYPFMAMIFDPMDWIPMIGATVKVNNLPRAIASTQGMLAVPPLHHIPWGIGFVLEFMMGNDQKMFFGGAKTHAEGGLLSAGPFMVMSCNDFGMPLSIKPGKNWKPIPSLYLPLSCSVPLPMGPPVNLNDPLVPDWSGMVKDLLIGAAFGYAMKGAGSMMTRFNHFLKGKFGETNVISRSLCKLKFEPVDLVRGNVVSYDVDFELPGPIPFCWERQYSSNATYIGSLGARWSTHYHQYMQYNSSDVSFEWLTSDGRLMIVPDLPKGEQLFVKSERCTFYHDEQGVRYFNHQEHLWYYFKSALRGDKHHYKLDSIQNNNGHSISFYYSVSGNLQKIIDSAGRDINVEINAKGLISRLTLSIPGKPFQLARYEYSAELDLIGVFDAAEKALIIKYNNHLMVEKTDRTGDTFYWNYDSSNLTARCIDTFGKDNMMRGRLEYEDDKTIVWDAYSNRMEIIHQNGLVVEELDSFGYSKKYLYNESMELIEKTDELERKTLYAYDLMGNRIATTYPDGSKVAMQFDQAGLLVMELDGAGDTAIYNYDEKGNLTRMIGADHSVIQYEYERGLTSKVITPAGQEFRLTYDAHYNLIDLEHPNKIKTTWKYNYAGKCTDVYKANGSNERYEYDDLGRLQGLLSADGNYIRFEYNAYDDIVQVKDRLAKVEMEYNSLGRLKKRRQLHGETNFFYDNNNRLTSIKNEAGENYYFKYGNSGKVIEETGFDGIKRQYIRNACGEVVTLVKPGGELVNYEYDGAGRVLNISYEDGTGEAYEYDRAGRLMSATNESSTTQFIRDKGGRIIKEIQNGIEVTRAFSRLGKPITVNSNLGASINFSYDDEGHLLGIIGANEVGKWAAMMLNDFSGFEIRRHLPGELILQQERNLTGQPLAQKLLAGDTLLFHKDYSWSAANRLQSSSNLLAGSFTAYQYDGLGNLTRSLKSTKESAMPTQVLRIPDKTANYYRNEDKSDREYGPGGRLLRAGSNTYTYNEEGSLIHKTDASGNWSYHYFRNGLLRSVVRPDKHEIYFTYDAIGRRLSKSYKGKITKWVWDGNVPLHEWQEDDQALEINHSGKIVDHHKTNEVTWVFEPDSFIPCAKLTETGTYSIIADQAGNPSCMVNESGRKVWESETDIYGFTEITVGKNEDLPFRNQGQYEDVETGLYYNRFRYYAPREGIYISQDPIRLKGGSRMYGYSPNPLKYLDILGLAKCKVTEVDALTHDLELTISRSDYPETAAHIQDAINAGHPQIVTIDRLGAKENRADSLFGIPTKPGFDRDEWPMAMFQEGGSGASVRYINPSDNRGAGSAIGNALSDYDPGTLVKIFVID